VSSSKDSELESLYSSLLHQSSPHEKAIQKDLTRTFPSHKFFQRPELVDGSDLDDRGRGQDELFNVVKAYSLCVAAAEARGSPAAQTDPSVPSSLQVRPRGRLCPGLGLHRRKLAAQRESPGSHEPSFRS
jgi:hypothetical protein